MSRIFSTKTIEFKSVGKATSLLIADLYPLIGIIGIAAYLVTTCFSE